MFDNPEDAATLVDDMVDYYYTLDISTDQKDYMKSFCVIWTSGNVLDQVLGTHIRTDPNNTTLKNVVKLRLQGLVKYIMNLAEYQLS